MSKFQVSNSVKVTDAKLEHNGAAGYVVADHTKLVDGAYVGKVEVRLDVDSEVYEFDVTQVEGL